YGRDSQRVYTFGNTLKSQNPILRPKGHHVRRTHWTRTLCLTVLLTTPLAAQVGRNRYVQTNLVSDVAGMAARTDSHLVNAWGLASSATGPLWVNANGTDLSLVYDGSGNGFPANNPLIVSIPGPSQGVPAEPTGIVFNGTSDFDGAVFLFANQAGTISIWK